MASVPGPAEKRRIAAVLVVALAALLCPGTASAAQKAGKKGGGAKAKPPKPKPPPAEAPSGDGAPADEPPAGGIGDSGAGDHGPPDGFGKGATGGGGGGGKSVPASAGAIAAAVKGGDAVRIAKGDVDCPFDQIHVGGNATVDGGGATLWFPGTNHNGRGVEVYGTNIVIRNLRIRNSGDGLGFGSANFKNTHNVLVENVSVTGCGDDGFSPAYNCSDLTFRWCLAAGNARSIFFKYGGHNLTVHHCIITHFWIRGPLANGATATLDFRNNLVQHWAMWGSECEDGSKGNYVNNTWRFEPWAAGKSDAALQAVKGGQIYSSGNVFEGCKPRPGGIVGSPVVDAPPLNRQDDAATALGKVLSDADGAGCMPRDAVDKAYLAAKQRSPSGDPAHGLQVPGSRLAK